MSSGSLAFVTHPSVRIKGTENAYTPTQCLDDTCPVKAPHLHCPFCVNTDAYQDPVILKAHYRVKHVDKGIEFAGLKILRCCDQCDIVGIIKGEKRFKGAHWHCYRCRNGFNRRDEAIKHYKTHFRNPQTTFQIQITQDLNTPSASRSQSDLQSVSTQVSAQNAFHSMGNPVQEIVHPALSDGLTIAQTNVMAAEAGLNGKLEVKVKDEPLDKDGHQEDQQTIMIIQGDQLETAFASHIINSGELTPLEKANIDSSISWEIRFRMEEEEKNMYKSKAQEYKSQIEVLHQQVAELEAQLAQQSALKLQDFITSLSSGDIHKQALGMQLTKFLEQVQNSHSSDSSPEQIDSNSSMTQLHDSSSMRQDLESDSGINQLNGIPEGYQVISTTPEGHMVISNARSSSLSSDDENISVSVVDSNHMPSALHDRQIDTSQKLAEQSRLILESVQARNNCPNASIVQIQRTANCLDSSIKIEPIQHNDGSTISPNSVAIDQSLLQVVSSEQSNISVLLENQEDYKSHMTKTISFPPNDGTAECEVSKQQTYVVSIVNDNSLCIKEQSEETPVQAIEEHTNHFDEPDLKRIKVVL